MPVTSRCSSRELQSTQWRSFSPCAISIEAAGEVPVRVSHSSSLKSSPTLASSEALPGCHTRSSIVFVCPYAIVKVSHSALCFSACPTLRKVAENCLLTCPGADVCSYQQCCPTLKLSLAATLDSALYLLTPPPRQSIIWASGIYRRGDCHDRLHFLSEA